MEDNHSGRQGVLLALVGQMDGVMRQIARDGANEDILMPMLHNWKHCLADLLDDRNKTDGTKKAYRL